jgi:enoyl-[acyl-carrier-protein] reductase (NADH)
MRTSMKNSSLEICRLFFLPDYAKNLNRQTRSPHSSPPSLPVVGKRDRVNGYGVLLASSASDFITGQTIFVDGGSILI